MNKWINHLSKKQQQWLLAVFCILTVAGLIVCLIAPYGKLAMSDPGRNYPPTHIGSPSEKPKPLQQTDSITLK
ncbi:hypothetical protein A0256_00295 [Mucilaginibacter sp. PAMC 26640]|nr:hypothetical protein A0256_00295 [Mucilaginibacter sp. PAMC 26640]